MKLKLISMLFLITITGIAADFDLDYAVFRGDEVNDIVEVYLMIPRDIFKFVESEDYYQSSVFVRVAFASDDTVRQMKEWSFADRVDDPEHVSASQKIPEIVTLSMPTGNYRIIAIIMDLNTKKTFREETDIVLREFSFQELDISDIQLSSQVSRTSEKNKFSKYFNYDIIPNASNVYGEQHSSIYAFCEVYNLKTGSGQSDYYQIQYSITDVNDNIIQLDDWQKKNKPGESAVEIKSMNISDLSSGLYNMKIAVKDGDSGNEVVTAKRFYIAKDDQEELLTQAIKDVDLSSLTENDLDDIFGPYRYIATDKEIRMYRKSNKDGKRNIINNFWRSRDPDPTTAVNEAEVNFKQRLAYANQQFKSQQREGWKTDRGRVFIIYGSPSEIERFPSSQETKPYQIWHYYEIEGGVYFVFADKTGFGMLELVHSTARNEIQDEQWERWVKPMINSDNFWGY